VNKAQYCAHKSPPFVPLLSQTNPVRNLPFSLFNMYCNITIHLFLGNTRHFFHSFPSHTSCMHFYSFHTCSMIAHLIRHWSTLILPGEQRKPFSSSLRSSLHAPLISTFLSTYTFLNMTLLTRLNLCSFFTVAEQSSTHVQ